MENADSCNCTCRAGSPDPADSLELQRGAETPPYNESVSNGAGEAGLIGKILSCPRETLLGLLRIFAVETDFP